MNSLGSRYIHSFWGRRVISPCSRGLEEPSLNEGREEPRTIKSNTPVFRETINQIHGYSFMRHKSHPDSVLTDHTICTKAITDIKLGILVIRY